MLARYCQTEVVETAELGQISSGEGSVVHAEVIWIGSVITTIIRIRQSLSTAGHYY